MGELDEPGLGLPLHLLPGLDTALRSMRAGERAFFSLAAAAAAEGPEGAFGGPQHAEAQEAVHCDVELISLTQIEDVSPHADRALLKTTLIPGRGGETPADGAHVVVHGPTSNPPTPPLDPHLRPQPALIRTRIPTPAASSILTDPHQVRASAYSTDGSFLNGTTNGTEWQMTLGDGSCADGLRLAVMSMRRAETARINISAHMARDPTLGLSGDEAVVVEIELLRFTQARALQQMSASEMAEHVGGIKATANKLFAAGERVAACAEYERGWHLLRASRTSKAAAEEASPLDALEAALLLNSAACAHGDGRHIEALAHAEAALVLSPNNATKANYRKGQALRGLGRRAEAEAAFSAVIKLEPHNRQAHTELAALAADALAEQVGGIKAAANKLFAAGERVTACAEYERGSQLLRSSRPSTRTVEEASPLDTLEVALLLNLAACAHGDGRHIEALAHAEAALVLSPDATKAHYRKGQALRGLGRRAEAEAAFSAVIELDPQNRQAQAELAALAAESTPAAAVAAAGVGPAGTGGQQISASEITEIKAAANKLFTAGERVTACAEYERGWNLLRSSRASTPTAEEASALDTLEVALLLNLAACAHGDGRHIEALAHAEAALVLSPDATKAHYRKGQALRGLGRRAEAEAAFSAVIELEPQNRQAQAELAALAAEATPAAAGEAAAVGS